LPELTGLFSLTDAPVRFYLFDLPGNPPVFA